MLADLPDHPNAAFKLSYAEKLLMHESYPQQYAYPNYYDTEELLAADPDAERETHFLKRKDGTYAIYKGCHASLYGEPGGGKTLIAKYMSAQAVNDGYKVRHIDIDDNRKEVIAHDVANFGASKTRMVDLWRLAQPDSRQRLNSLYEDFTSWETPDLVIIDSMASLEALAAADANLSHEFVANVFLPYIKTITSLGSTVVSIDHVSVKNKEARGAMGSTAKLAKTDLAIHVVVPEGGGLIPGQLGSVALYVDKDRHGVTKSHGQMREYAKGHMRCLWGNFTIPVSGLADATVEAPYAAAENRVYNF